MPLFTWCLTRRCLNAPLNCLTLEVVVVTSMCSDSREEQLQVVLTEFVGQNVSAWGSWLLYQVFVEAHDNEPIDGCLFRS